MEKNIKKDVCFCVELSHFAVQQRSAQHYKSAILQFFLKKAREKEILDRDKAPGKKKLQRANRVRRKTSFRRKAQERPL